VKSLTVCVEYDDFLAYTLPRNRRHFEQTLVVTSTRDKQTQQIAFSYGVNLLVTDIFYDRGAAFNKGAAIEQGFDELGRDGWICVWDADIVLPDSIQIPVMDRSCLYAPIRRIVETPREFIRCPVTDWEQYPSPTRPGEFSGYCQIFHASAINPPWHTSCWPHCGGGDSDFEQRYPPDKKIRPPWEVLHLGPEGLPENNRVGWNWCGRVTPRIDNGERVSRWLEHLANTVKIIESRKAANGPSAEKLCRPSAGKLP